MKSGTCSGSGTVKIASALCSVPIILMSWMGKRRCSARLTGVKSKKLLTRCDRIYWVFLYGFTPYCLRRGPCNFINQKLVQRNERRDCKSRMCLFTGSSNTAPTGFNGTNSDAVCRGRSKRRPLLSTPNIFAGARLTTTTTSFPTSSSGV